MKSHNGIKRKNKLDSGKNKAKKQYHKVLRESSKIQIKTMTVTCVNCGSHNADTVQELPMRRPNGDNMEEYFCNECECRWAE